MIEVSLVGGPFCGETAIVFPRELEQAHEEPGMIFRVFMRAGRSYAYELQWNEPGKPRLLYQETTKESKP